MRTVYLSAGLGVEISTFVTSFPQHKIVSTPEFPVGREYYLFQRKSDLPEGEGGLTVIFENRQRYSIQATGNGRRLKALAASGILRSEVKARASLVGAKRFQDNKRCDLGPEPDL
jgi:hypothetical protein